MKHELAILAVRRFQNKLASLVAGNGFYDMLKMVFDLAFRNDQHLRQLVRGQTGADQ